MESTHFSYRFHRERYRCTLEISNQLASSRSSSVRTLPDCVCERAIEVIWLRALLDLTRERLNFPIRSFFWGTIPVPDCLNLKIDFFLLPNFVSIDLPFFPKNHHLHFIMTLPHFIKILPTLSLIGTPYSAEYHCQEHTNLFRCVVLYVIPINPRAPNSTMDQSIFFRCSRNVWILEK